MCAALAALPVSLIANEIAPEFLLHIRRHSHDTCVNCCNGRNRSSESESTVWQSRRDSAAQCAQNTFSETHLHTTRPIFPSGFDRFNLHHHWDKLFKNALSFGVCVAEVSSISNRIQPQPLTSSPIGARFPFSLVRAPSILSIFFSVECELLKFSKVKRELQSRALHEVQEIVRKMSHDVLCRR